MKKVLLSVVAFLCCFSSSTYAQQQGNCGVNQEVDALIKQRLMDNRAKFSKQQIVDLTTNRTITYIPISFHSVSNSLGEGAATEREIFDFLCGLNDIYFDQDIQFFVYNQINFHSNNSIDDDAGTNASAQAMQSWKVNGTLNITIGRSLSNPTSSWYAGFGSDYIFLLKQMMSPAAKTEAHEIGHFFSLPHTFYGWEGIDAEADYGGQNVPATINGTWTSYATEAVPRTGPQANCTSAGDGFCGTEADYYSSRTNCPYQVTCKDSHGNALDPDESNIMSYALDACVTTFSLDQKAAIAMDVANRNWVTNTPPSTNDIAAEPVTSPVSPTHQGLLGNVNNSTVRLEWAPVTGATWYRLEVYGTLFAWVADVNDVIYKEYIWSGDNFMNIPTANMQAGQRYVWRVTPISNYSTCALPSPYYGFEASSSVTTDLKDLPIEKQMSFEVNANPITTSYIPMSIYAAEDVIGSIRLYAIDGKEVLSLTKTAITQGESVVQLPAENLTNGVYVAVLSTDRGHLQQKIVLQR